jgi:hypothetical protein
MSATTQHGVPMVERFCLARLERFSRIASQPEVVDVPAWRRLARHATLAAYRDCVMIGVGAEARRLLATARHRDEPIEQLQAG